MYWDRIPTAAAISGHVVTNMYVKHPIACWYIWVSKLSSSLDSSWNFLPGSNSVAIGLHDSIPNLLSTVCTFSV